MADISSLNLNDPDQIDYDHYKDTTEYRRPPVEGKYFLQAPALFKVDPTSKGEKGHILVYSSPKGILSAAIDGAVITNSKVEGAEGYVINRFWVNIAKSQFREGSSMDDYLRAHGINAGPLMTGKAPKERLAVYANLLESTAGRMFEATTKIEYRCGDCDEKKSQKSGYAKDTNGGLLSVVPCMTCKKDIFARLIINKFISKVGAATAATQQPAYA